MSDFPLPPPPPLSTLQQTQLQEGDHSSGILAVAGVTFAQATMGALGAVVPMMYPLLRRDGVISVQMIGIVASLPMLVGLVLPPVIGLIGDLASIPFMLPIGLALGAVGAGLLGGPLNLMTVIGAILLLAIGQSIFRPMGARAVRQGAGGWQGTAMGFFLAAGYAGTMSGPLQSAILTKMGQRATLQFAMGALPALAALVAVAIWQQGRVPKRALPPPMVRPIATPGGMVYPPMVVQRLSISGGSDAGSILVLLTTAVAKMLYLAAMATAYGFYLTSHAHATMQEVTARFLMQGALVVAGMLLGGVLSDFMGQRTLILASAVMTLAGMALPYVGDRLVMPLAAGTVFCLGLGMAPILTALQDLAPSKPGLMAGLFLGTVAAGSSLLWSTTFSLWAEGGADALFRICSYVPLLGLVALLLPVVMRQEARPARM